MILAADQVNSDSYYTQWQEYGVWTDVLCWDYGRKQNSYITHISRKGLSTAGCCVYL